MRSTGLASEGRRPRPSPGRFARKTRRPCASSDRCGGPETPLHATHHSQKDRDGVVGNDRAKAKLLVLPQPPLPAGRAGRRVRARGCGAAGGAPPAPPHARRPRQHHRLFPWGGVPMQCRCMGASPPQCQPPSTPAEAHTLARAVAASLDLTQKMTRGTMRMMFNGCVSSACRNRVGRECRVGIRQRLQRHRCMGARRWVGGVVSGWASRGAMESSSGRGDDGQPGRAPDRPLIQSANPSDTGTVIPGAPARIALPTYLHQHVAHEEDGRLWCRGSQHRDDAAQRTGEDALGGGALVSIPTSLKRQGPGPSRGWTSARRAGAPHPSAKSQDGAPAACQGPDDRRSPQNSPTLTCRDRR